MKMSEEEGSEDSGLALVKHSETYFSKWLLLGKRAFRLV